MTGARPVRRAGVFISYRREDAASAAGWLFDRLADQFGRGRVFKDVDSIRPGADFTAEIMTAIGSSAVLLAVIGQRWLTAADPAGRRLDDPGDLVRLEIEEALARGLLVIPVLVDRPPMPSAAELPASLAGLPGLQAVELSPARFKADADYLVRALKPVLREASRRRALPGRKPFAIAAAGAAAVAAVVLVLLAAQNSPAPAPPPVKPMLTLYDPGSTGVPSVAFTRGGDLVAGDLNGTAYLWDIGHVQIQAKFPSTNGQGIFGVTVSPDGSMLAVATLNSRYNQGSIVLWDVAIRKPVATLNDRNGNGTSNPVVFTADGDTLAVADSNGKVYLWKSATGQPVGVLPDPDSQSGENDSGLAISPRTGYLAAGDGDGTTYLWDIQRRKLVSAFQDRDSKGVTGGVAFSTDGSLLAAGDGNGNVYLWNVATGALAATLHGPAGEAIGGVAFSRDRILAATADSTNGAKHAICIWNTAHKLAATLQDPSTDPAYRLAFSPDGSELAVGDNNAHTYIWSMSWLTA
jgi:hypothetical protein